MGGYISPVSDAYKKQGLANSAHRIRMCELAVEEQQGGWLMVDPWEALQPTYIPTANVLDHFQHEINEVLGGAERPDGTQVPMRIILLAGADLIQTMSTPGVWSSDDLDHILRGYGAFIVERAGTDINDALESLQLYKSYKDNISVSIPMEQHSSRPDEFKSSKASGKDNVSKALHVSLPLTHVIPQLIQNDVSSTKIRLFLRREMSVRYLIPSSVIEYIEEQGLYLEDGTSSSREKGKLKGMENFGRTSPAHGTSGSKS
ncbi:MAG: hypothetical protein M1818_004445 [Claussenomyces sp. TS43310]|nr:MAG: hypothetical protein M1818_004445 [Claussenomyces sp. TS43310]